MNLSGSTGQPSPALLVLWGCVLALIHWGCGGNGDGGTSSMLQIAFSSSPPPAGQADVVWISDGGLSGDMQTVDVVARDIDTAFDRYDLEITFDPFVVTAAGMTSGSFLAGCSGVPELTLQNVTGGAADANVTGRILFSTSLPAGIPGCPLPSLGTLARIVFRPVNAGSSVLQFSPCDDTDPADLKGSCLLSGNPAVKDPDVQFLSAGATLVTTQ